MRNNAYVNPVPSVSTIAFVLIFLFMSIFGLWVTRPRIPDSGIPDSGIPENNIPDSGTSNNKDTFLRCEKNNKEL